MRESLRGGVSESDEARVPASIPRRTWLAIICSLGSEPASRPPTTDDLRGASGPTMEKDRERE